MARVEEPDPSGPILVPHQAGIYRSRLRNQQTVANWIGHPDRNTNEQQAHRTMLAFLALEWAGINAEDRFTWEDYATGIYPSAYAAYLSYNLQRWEINKYPTRAYPATETGPMENEGFTSNITTAGLVIITTIQAPNDTQAWPFAMAYTHLIPRLPSHRTAHLIIPWTSLTPGITLRYLASAPGLWYLVITNANPTGRYIGQFAEFPITLTT